jgi:hypothetical protein
MRKIKYNRKKPRNKYLVFLAIILIPVAYFFVFVMNSNNISQKQASEYLIGSWSRTDGPYTIKISAVNEEGVLKAEYLNPNPIKVDRATWKVQEEKLQIYVLMDDVNYRGSFYDLAYDEEKEILSGNYFQAGTKQTYKVIFKRAR